MNPLLSWKRDSSLPRFVHFLTTNPPQLLSSLEQLVAEKQMNISNN